MSLEVFVQLPVDVMYCGEKGRLYPNSVEKLRLNESLTAHSLLPRRGRAGDDRAEACGARALFFEILIRIIYRQPPCCGRLIVLSISATRLDNLCRSTARRAGLGGPGMMILIPVTCLGFRGATRAVYPITRRPDASAVSHWVLCAGHRLFLMLQSPLEDATILVDEVEMPGRCCASWVVTVGAK